MVSLASLKTSWDKLNAPNSKIRRYDRPLAYWVTTLALLLAIVGTVSEIAQLDLSWTISFLSVQGSLGRDSLAHGDADVARVAPDLQSKLPQGVHLDGSIPVSVEVDRSSFMSKILSRLAAVPMDLIVVAIVWLLRKMVLSAVSATNAPANPFVRVNVTRLRTMGALMLAAPIIGQWSQFAEAELVTRTLDPKLFIFSWDASNVLLQLGIGMLLFTLAEVFASGIRLREDVEGLV